MFIINDHLYSRGEERSTIITYLFHPSSGLSSKSFNFSLMNQIKRIGKVWITRGMDTSGRSKGMMCLFDDMFVAGSRKAGGKKYNADVSLRFLILFYAHIYIYIYINNYRVI